MGYASQTNSEQVHLQEKVQQALVKLASANLLTEPQLAASILRQPESASRIGAIFVQANSGVSVESTDAAIDAALTNATTIAALKAHFGI